MAKRILHKFQLDEISGVDRMAQAGAKMVLMKRDNSDIAKGAFVDAVTVMEADAAVHALWWELWESETAIYNAIDGILSNPDRYPDVQGAIVEALGEYSAKVQEQAADAAAAVPSMDDDNSSSDGLTNKSDHSDGDNDNQLIPEEDTEMSKKIEPTVETLTADLAASNEKFEKSESFGKLNDAEKAYYTALDDEGQVSFLKMDEGARANVLEKADEADSVVYTSADGEEFRKSDDPRLVKMARQGDEDRKIAKAERERRETMEFTKRADDELSHLPGDAPVKVALLKAVEGIKDEAHRTAIGEMFKAADISASGAFETGGTTDIAKGDAEEQLNTLAKAYAKEHTVSDAVAMDEILKTDEGSRLYTQTQS
ncbi:MAG: hypothetical protein ACTSUU_06905 [Candidatus Thorarchaeota archaeon]